MGINKIQIGVATGRFTLPVVTIVGLLLWLVNLDSWQDLGTLAIVLFTCYLMIEINTTFSLIRTRTTLHICSYWLWISIFIFLHPFEWECSGAVAFMSAVVYLFKSYESSNTSTSLFNVSFFITSGSLLFPKLIYFLPLFILSTIGIRSLNIKSLIAFLLGCLTPYWLLFGYAFFYDQMEIFYTPLKESFTFHTVDYTSLPNHVIISWLAITLLQLVCSIHFSKASYQDKTRTRIFLTFLTIAGWWTTVFIAVQPQLIYPLLFIQLICTSFLTAHLFTLTRNRFSGIGFIVNIISLIVLTCYNLWM